MGFGLSFALSMHFLLLYSLFSFTVTNCLVFVAPSRCHADESNALLQFKERFVISKSASYDPLSYPKMASWNSSTDCCSWDGIQCDHHTSHVIAVNLSSSQIYGKMDSNSSLFHLKHLQKLDLADNDFNNSQIPSRIGELSQLRYLNLSVTNFVGEIPQPFSHLSKLLSLDLYVSFHPDADNLLSLKITTLKSLIQNSTNLQVLGLSYVTISSSVPTTFTNLTSLQHLTLYQCELYGEFPTGIFHLPYLSVLNLGNNPNLAGKFPDFQSSAQITMLYLARTSFYGTLPASIGNLKSLNWFSISDCNFSGSIPTSFGNLTQLIQLDVRNNNFKGHLPSFLVNLTKLRTLGLGFNEFTTDTTISWICKLSRISYLELDYVNIGSEIPSCFTNLTQLSLLTLSHSNLSGQIPSMIMNLTNLAYMDLTGNNLRGEIPNSLFKLENLKTFYLASNLLEGELELDKFLMLKMLVGVELSFNRLSLISGKNPSNASLSQINALGMGSCNLNEIPNFLRDLAELSYLYMPTNNVSSLPSWMWGKKSLQILDVSDNSLIGKISPLICKLYSLVDLELSFNNLTGMIPSCLTSSIQSLQTLALNGNKLFGPIPQVYTITSDLRMINLSNNNLQGQLPRTLVNCRLLEYIDVSQNQINDSFPCWLGTLPELKVVALSDNHLYGSIRCPTTCTFPKLHIIVLSRNHFSGSLPSNTIQNWISMKASNKSQLQYERYLTNMTNGNLTWSMGNYTYSFTLFNKGMVMSYENLQEFYNLIAIDLSSNKFCGEIPDVLGDLTGLVLLNLSNNMLSGGIPSSLGKLSNLEALDLSLNSLSGRIPQQLAELTFLSFVNVSFNNLSGPIPQNKQFSTFEGNSFEGNRGLCGNQLLKKCEDHGGLPSAPPSDDDDQDSGFLFEFDWKVVLIGYGGGLIAGVALGRAFGQEVLEWLKRLL